MGEQHQIAEDIVGDRASSTTDPVTNLRTGSVFTAEIDGSPDALVIATELGEDYRNVILLHVTDDDEAAAINDQDQVQFRLFGRTVKARIIKRRDSGGSVQTDFWAEQLTNLDT